MKLTEIDFESTENSRPFNLGRLTGGLNFIYGENHSGKSDLRRCIQHVLLGSGFQTHAPRGHLSFQAGSDEFRMQRDSHSSSNSSSNSKNGVRVQSLSGSPLDAPRSFNGILETLTSEIYNTIFSYSLRQTRENAPQLANVLHSRLGIPKGATAAGDEATYVAYKRDADARSSQLATLRLRIEELNRQRHVFVRELEAIETTRRSQVAAIENQIQAVGAQINGFDFQNKQNQLAMIDRQIHDVRNLIDQSLQQSVTYIPTNTSTDQHSTLYQRLDEIDNQIRRWRHVQTDIQSQRVRLKDEMVVWNELTLESTEHPYHNAREILQSLENKVEQAHRHASQWSQTAQHRTDPTQLANDIDELCGQMKDDLSGLCQELGQQYKHIRHKSAAAELKQLRRCYNEMGENTQRLVQRRDAVVNEIRTIDPAGADAIQSADNRFCQCAMHEGYLEARRRYVSSAPTAATEIRHQVVTPDMSQYRQRLDSLETQRREMVTWLGGADSQLASLKARHADLVQQRETLRIDMDPQLHGDKLARVESELRKLNEDHGTLLRQVEDDRRHVQPSPNAILVRAATLLQRVTGGELLQVSLSDARSPSDFQVRNRVGKVLNFSALETSLQDQVYLCLTFAAKEALEAQGVSAPSVIDDAFANIDRDRIQATLELYSELCRCGHQMLLLTQHRYLADRISGAMVFELPPITTFPNPVSAPERANPLPHAAPVRDASYYSAPILSTYPSTSNETAFTNEYRAYPFSKYPIAEVEFDSSANLIASLSSIPENSQTQILDPRDTTSFIVPHPIVAHQEVAFGLSHSGDAAANSTSSVAPVHVQDVGDPLGYASAIDDHTGLGHIDFLDLHQLRAFSDSNVETVGQLLALNPAELPATLRDNGISPDQVDRWQSQVWLLTNVTGLRIHDARILVACGITEPEHLATSHAQQLFERIQRFLASSEGHRFATGNHSFSLDRINGWYRALDSTRSRWDRSDGYSRSSRQQRSTNAASSSSDRQTPRAYREHQPRSQRRQRDSERSERTERQSSNLREPRVARPPRMRTPEKRSSAPSLAPVKTKRAMDKSSRSDGDTKLRFYLDLNDHIEAAPSIGPKTAERFEKIGVVTIADFLKQTAESMAAKIKYKRISADVIRDWQHQARLVCRIPNLRGHDAQILVACEFTQAEEIATLQPAKLFEIVEPFAETKEGLKIIRNGKKPDLAEITDWITWAGHTRSLQAA